MHKTMNVLNCLPKSVQAKAKQALHAIWQAETKANAEKAFDLFVGSGGNEHKQRGKRGARGRSRNLSGWNIAPSATPRDMNSIRSDLSIHQHDPPSH